LAVFFAAVIADPDVRENGCGGAGTLDL
jgi:hypothetical protein